MDCSLPDWASSILKQTGFKSLDYAESQLPIAALFRPEKQAVAWFRPLLLAQERLGMVGRPRAGKLIFDF